MPTEQFLNSFVINQVDTADTLDAMDAAGLVNPNELYLVEEGDFNMVLDEQPTEGSRNLVTSGGIYQAIQNIPTPDVSGQIGQHNTSEEAHSNMGWIRVTDEEIGEAVPIDADTLEGKTVQQIVDMVPTPDVSGQINTHNSSSTAHSDIRTAVSNAASAASNAQTTANEAKTTASSKASTAIYSVSINTSWSANSAGGFYKTVTVSGMLATDNPIADVILGSDIAANAIYLEAWALITRITTAANSITLYANGDAPATAFNIQLKVVR